MYNISRYHAYLTKQIELMIYLHSVVFFVWYRVAW
jgi:hypothetical protein